MPYHIELRERPTPLNPDPQWSALSQADWLLTKEACDACVQHMYEDDGPDGSYEYRTAFFKLRGAS